MNDNLTPFESGMCFAIGWALAHCTQIQEEGGLLSLERPCDLIPIAFEQCKDFIESENARE